MSTINASETKSSKNNKGVNNTKTQNSRNTHTTQDEFQKTVHENSRLFAVFTHIAGIFVGPLLPLVIYLVVNDKLVKEDAKEVLNFELNIWFWIAVLTTIAAISFTLFFLVVPIISGVIAVIGLFGLVIAQIVLPIFGAISANEGKVYKYPFIYRIIK